MPNETAHVCTANKYRPHLSVVTEFSLSLSAIVFACFVALEFLSAMPDAYKAEQYTGMPIVLNSPKNTKPPLNPRQKQVIIHQQFLRKSTHSWLLKLLF